MGIQRIDYTRCNDCSVCYDICPMDVFRKLGKKVFISYARDCMTCFLCELECAPDAIYVSPERTKKVYLPY